MLRINSYVFGDHFMCQPFKETVLPDIVEDPYVTLRCNDSIYVFTNLPESDPLVSFLVYQYCRNFCSTVAEEADI